MKSKKIIIATVSTIVAIAILWFCFGGKSKSANYIIETAQAVRGDVSEAVTATGTIEPVTQVEVGTQVSGIIDKLYADYNSIVTKGQLIAEMDKVTLQSELTSQQATYDGAKAEYEYQEKTFSETRPCTRNNSSATPNTKSRNTTTQKLKVPSKAARQIWLRLNEI